MSSNNFSFWQSPLWNEILGRTGQAEVIRLPYEEISVLIERRHIWGRYTGLYILGIEGKWADKSLMESVRKNVANTYDLFLQIEPYTPFLKGGGTQGRGDLSVINPQSSQSSDSSFKKELLAPFRRFLEPVTAVLYLQSPCHVSAVVLTKEEGGEEGLEKKKGVLSEEDLLKNFAEKGRYNIRLAQKRGVTTRWVKANDTMNNVQCTIADGGDNLPLHIEDCTLKIKKTYLEAFFDLLDETTKRDKFAHNSLQYYQNFVEVLEKNNAGGLLIAEKDGVLHAGGIFVYTPGNLSPTVSKGEEVNPPSVDTESLRGQGTTAIYYYGASSSDPEIRRDMATYLLQWDAIREAKRRGCVMYDFLGISEDGGGKLAGVTEFKMRFNPEKKYWPAEQVFVFRPILLFLLQCVSRVRKIFK